MKRSLFLLLILFSLLPGFAQTSTPFHAEDILSHDAELSGRTINTFRSVSEAEGVIRSILDVVGLKPNFEIRAADISNAAAVVYNGERYILYDRAFINSINNASSTQWAGISILAHEIGHHLNGHTLNRGGSNHADELEADEFSGFVLRKLGASLTEAQAAMHTVSEDYDTATHPERNRRLQAIALGWNHAGEQTLAQQPAEPESEVYTPAPAQMPNNQQQMLASQYILREVYFENAPGAKFYITTNHNLVAVKNNQLLLCGKLKKTNSTEFPYILTDEEESVIYVAQNGYLFNTEGDKIGFLKVHQS